MLNPLSLAGLGLAWYSMDGSLRELRQMAQVSAQESQDHMATAFHFLISKRGAGRDFLADFFLSVGAAAAAAAAAGGLALSAGGAAAEAASAISTSSVFFSVSTMVVYVVYF